MTPYYTLTNKELAETFHTDNHKGLTQKEVEKRQKRYGKNIFKKTEKLRFFNLLLSQIKSPLALILIIAGVITLFLQAWADTIVIFLAVFINTGIGIFQEGKAGQAFEKLRLSQKKEATVFRDGHKKIVLAEEIVPGDVVMLNTGNSVPADLRIVESKEIKVNESALTGEWIAVPKENTILEGEKRITEQSNMLWMGTLITSGWGKAIVVATGMKTEFGKIAGLVRESEPPTPFQKNVAGLARFLSFIILVTLIILFTLGILRGEAVSEMFLVAVAVAVAAIPSGLPVAVTVVLAIGMSKILKEGGLVKRLSAAETLGSATVILTDKTGTLTKAKMQVAAIVTFASLENSKEGELHKHTDQKQLLQMAMLSGNAFIENSEKNLEEWVVRGKPMDKAILLAGIESGNDPDQIFKKNPRIDFIPFESKIRFSASLNKLKDGRKAVYLMGSPELMLEVSNKIYHKGKTIKLTEKEKINLRKVYEGKTASGMRMIAIAYKETDLTKFKETDKNLLTAKKDNKGLLSESEFIFAGFIGFHDPLREDVKESILLAKKAGIRSIMVTGDHKITARKVACEAGLITKDDLVLNGEEIEDLNEKDLQEIVRKVSVFARVLPHQKLAIARALQKNGEIVAMTGDGVNDAPALSNADIGIVLGSGTEVAKEAGDIILLNNSFSVIVSAIKEGRRIIDNLKRIVIYLLSTGFSEIILISITITAGLPLPILPVQILWTNIIEEGFMNFAFAFEQPEKGLMQRKPINTEQGILEKRVKHLIIILSLITSVLLVAIYFVLLQTSLSIEKVRTIMFAALSIDSLFFTFSLKNMKEPIWKISIFSNIYLVVAFMISMFMLLVALFVPPIRNLLSLVPLTTPELLFIVGVGVFNLTLIEVVKYYLFERKVVK